jgi:predicted component of viral defense system (DUF524 family)
MWWIVTILLTLIGVVVGLVYGATNAFQAWYIDFLQEVSSWGWKFFNVGVGLGVALGIGQLIYLRQKNQRLTSLEKRLKCLEEDLKREKEAFRQSIVERTRIIFKKGEMLFLELKEYELASALGEQTRRIEQAFHEAYEDLIEDLKNTYEKERASLKFTIKRLSLMVDSDKSAQVQKLITHGTAKEPKNDHPKLIEGRPIKHRKSQ